jgi:hypothetical protein
MVYWAYNPLNMFRELLCPSSGARDYTVDYSMWHITLCLKLVMWSGVGLWALCSGLRNVARLRSPDETTWPALNKVLCVTCCNHLYSPDLLIMGITMPETCWADYKLNKPLCSIWLDFLSTYHQRRTVKHSTNLHGQYMSVFWTLCEANYVSLFIINSFM